MIIKNRKRDKYTFANINLLGKCNADCYFCLGKDIPELLNKHNQIHTHFSQWKNFEKFLKQCKSNNINKLYLTGQNTDALCYDFFEEIVIFLKSKGFKIGIRTNGYLIERNIHAIRNLNGGIGLSIHTLNADTNLKIMGINKIVNWVNIIPRIKTENNTVRVAIVINRYNKEEIIPLIAYLSQFKQIQYIQARRISTDTRYEELKEDIKIYESLYQSVIKTFPVYDNFYSAQRVNMFGKEVCWWRTVETTANSLNYFTDGTISDNYFVVEGYLNNYKEEN